MLSTYNNMNTLLNSNLGEAYETVKTIYDNLTALLLVETNLDKLQEIHDNLDKFNSLVDVQASFDAFTVLLSDTEALVAQKKIDTDLIIDAAKDQAIVDMDAEVALVAQAKDDRLDVMVADVLAVANQKIYATTQIQQNVDDLPSIVAASIATYVAYNPRGTWQTNTVYNRNDIWEDNGTYYLTLFDYTSGADVASDLATDNVILHQQKSIVVQVENVATLRLTEPMYDGQIVEVGYHNAIGYGGGKFRSDYGDTTSVDNNGTVIVTTSGSKRWKRIFVGLCNIDDFGCVPNDGRDNTVNMKKALDTIGTVTASLGRYVIGDLLIPSGVSIICYSGRAYNQTIYAKTIFEARPGALDVFDMSDSRGNKFSTFHVDLNVSGAYRTTNGFYARNGNTNQNTFEDVVVGFANVAFGAAGAYTFNSTTFRTTSANQGVHGYTNLVDCRAVGATAAGNTGRPISLLAGHNSNVFIDFKAEWNAETILLYQTSSISFIGGFFDRAYESSMHISSTKSTLICGGLFKRSGRNTAVAITAAREAAVQAGTDPDVAEANALISEQRSHFVIEGNNEGLVISAITTSTGTDDSGGSEQTTVSPEHIFEWVNASGTVDTTITGNNLKGYRTSPYVGSLPTDKIIMQNNSGVSTVILGQDINQVDGRQFQSSALINSVTANGGTKTVSLKQVAADQFRNPFRELKISARRTDTGSDYFTQYNGGLSRESGTPSLKLYLAYESTIGAITLNDTVGTTADISLTNFSSDGTTFDLTVTNKHASSNIDVAVELT